MFENYSDLSDAEKALVKKIHQNLCSSSEHIYRYGNLAWGYVRGFQYRRVERTNHQHHKADYYWLRKELEQAFRKAGAPESWLPSEEVLQAWLDNPEGAIPVPVRVKKPYPRPEAAE